MKQVLKKTVFLLLAICLCLGTAAGGANALKVSAVSRTKVNKQLSKKMDQTLKKIGVTSSTDESAALKLIFDYMKDKDNFGYAREMGFTGKAGWETDYAKQMLTSGKGSCYHYAATYALLAARATGYLVRIGWGESSAFRKGSWQQHAWVEVKIGKKWYTFDPNAACYSSRKANWFKQKRAKMVGNRKYYRTPTYVTVEL